MEDYKFIRRQLVAWFGQDLTAPPRGLSHGEADEEALVADCQGHGAGIHGGEEQADWRGALMRR
jgi:hypothetical protein